MAAAVGADAGEMTTDELRSRGRALFPELSQLGPSALERWPVPKHWPLAHGGALWVKRDDLLGEGGTKVRKLTVALARAQASGRGLLTVGHLDSNHAPATARAAALLGVPVELALWGRPHSDPVRAVWLRSLAPVRFYSSALGLVFGTAVRLWRARRQLDLFPPGGTTAVTTAAVALAVAEVVGQFEALGEPIPTRWAIAVGSGGSFAGLLAGARALGLSVAVTGVVASSRLLGRRREARLANAALRLLGCTERVVAGDVKLQGRQAGAGHGVPTAASQAAARELGALGHQLDPIFTAKAMAEVAAASAPGERWLFWHSGVAVSPPPG